jgi:hypothetical protein
MSLGVILLIFQNTYRSGILFMLMPVMFEAILQSFE